MAWCLVNKCPYRVYFSRASAANDHPAQFRSHDALPHFAPVPKNQKPFTDVLVSHGDFGSSSHPDQFMHMWHTF
eukprot:5864728-Amphidinium_carterae.2